VNAFRSICFVACLALTGCASVEPFPVGVAKVRSVLGRPGAFPATTIDLGDRETRQIHQGEYLTGGAFRHFVYRDDHETWFRTRLSLRQESVPVKWTHSAELRLPPPDAPDVVHYLCRGWIGFDDPLPGGTRIVVRERVLDEHGFSVVDRSLLTGEAQDGKVFLRLLPLDRRRVDLQRTKGKRRIRVEYSVEMTRGSGRVDADVYLSPQIMTGAEWGKEMKAKGHARRLLALDDSVETRLFIDLYLNSAADYVMAHLPREERMHCFLQADLVRDWHREVIRQYPQIHRRLRMSGLRRAPGFQSSNLIRPRGERSPRSYLRKRDAVILDTWREDGGVETKIQSYDEFRRFLNFIRVQETVRRP
jgi:hypothetical protein